MLPSPETITNSSKSGGIIEEINLEHLLKTINERIEILVDRDHTIGHAFFMNTNTLKDLKAVIANKIIPLLQEYFYGDYHKMELVLGNGFFKKKAVDKVKFAVTTDLQFEGEMFTILDAKKMSDKDFKDAITGIGFNAE
jgi:5-methylcytosine-specific restriction protein B